MSDKPSGTPTPADFFNWLNQFVKPQPTEPGKTAAYDPMGAWKTFNEQNQKAWSEALNRMKSASEFSGVAGQASINQNAAMELTRKAAEAYLKAANMPSLDDLAKVAQLVSGVEAKLDKLDQKPSTYINQTNPVNSLDKINRNLAGLEESLGSRVNSLELSPGKVEELAARLAAIETKLDKLTGPQLAQAPEPVGTTPLPKPKPARASKRPRPAEPDAQKSEE